MQTTQEDLLKHLRFLCEIQPARNYRNIASLNKIAQYIFSFFEEQNLPTKSQDFQVKLPENVNIPTKEITLVESYTYKNIIAEYQPQKESKLIVGAHYDVDGEQPGADDNASAVAILLELAKQIAQTKPSLDYGIEFVAYSLEESPFFYTPYMGSAVHAKSLKQNNTKVKAMICLEMLGYFSDEENSQRFPVPELALLFPSKGNFVVVVGRKEEEFLTKEVEKYMMQGGGVGIYSLNAPIEYLQDITRSDHYNYWKEGYPALMLTDTSFLRNPNYHQKTDTIDTLNLEKMSELTKQIYWAIVNL